MAMLNFNIHIRPATGFDERRFIEIIQMSIDSCECGLRTLSVQHVCDQTDFPERTEKIYECKVEIQQVAVPGIEPYMLIFGALSGSIRDDPTFEILGFPHDEMAYFKWW